MTRLRSLLKPGLGVLAGLVAAVAVLLVLQERDEPGFDEPAAAPGRAYRGEPVLSPALEDAVRRGNVVILHRDARPPAGTRELQTGAPPSLEPRGLAVLLEREPTLHNPLAAVSRRRIQTARRPQALRRFIDYHLGRRGP